MTGKPAPHSIKVHALLDQLALAVGLAFGLDIAWVYVLAVILAS